MIWLTIDWIGYTFAVERMCNWIKTIFHKINAPITKFPSQFVKHEIISIAFHYTLQPFQTQPIPWVGRSNGIHRVLKFSLEVVFRLLSVVSASRNTHMKQLNKTIHAVHQQQRKTFWASFLNARVACDVRGAN